MKKVFVLFILLGFAASLVAQPIRLQPQKSMLRAYEPPESIPPIKKYPTKRRTQRYNIPVATLNKPVGTKDTLFAYVYLILDYPVIEFPVDATPRVAADMTPRVAELPPKPVMDTALLRNIFIPEHYRRTGMTKILSGAGLQAIAIGLVAYANIDITSVHDVTQTHVLPYTFPVYELVNGAPIVTTSTTTTIDPPITTTTTTTDNSSNVDYIFAGGRDHHCRPHPVIGGGVIINNTITSTTTTTTTINSTTNVNVTVTTPNPTLNIHMETGTINYTETHQQVEVHERNKTPYYIGGGVLAAAGVALEVLGIIDLHKANVYVTNNSVGFVFKF